jgi:hypothetical protein
VSVPDRSLYVGFAQPEMYDVPLLTTGLEHLYATLNPSPDLHLSAWRLHEILYEHLVTRRAAPANYDALSPEAQLGLAEYVERCKSDSWASVASTRLPAHGDFRFPSATLAGEASFTEQTPKRASWTNLSRRNNR